MNKLIELTKYYYTISTLDETNQILDTILEVDNWRISASIYTRKRACVRIEHGYCIVDSISLTEATNLSMVEITTQQFVDKLKEVIKSTQVDKKYKIYLIETLDNIHYNEYDGIVVIELNKSDAIKTAKETCDNFTDNLRVTEIGIANSNLPKGCVLASFNAG